MKLKIGMDVRKVLCIKTIRFIFYLPNSFIFLVDQGRRVSSRLKAVAWISRNAHTKGF